MKIFLCGPPAVGKSTIAQILALKLGWKAIDLDREIEKRWHLENGVFKSFQKIFLDEGEHNFQFLVLKSLVSLSYKNQSVIALSGGVVDKACLGKNKVSVYLKASLNTLWQRILSRPKLPVYLPKKGKRKCFERKINSRLSLYEKMADLTVATDHLTPEDVAQKILSTIGDHIPKL